MENYKVIYLGYIEHGTGQHQSNTVTSVNGVSPALTTLQGGTQQIKILVGEDGYKSGYRPMIVETKDEYTQNN